MRTLRKTCSSDHSLPDIRSYALCVEEVGYAQLDVGKIMLARMRFGYAVSTVAMIEGEFDLWLVAACDDSGSERKVPVKSGMGNLVCVVWLPASEPNNACHSSRHILRHAVSCLLC